MTMQLRWGPRGEVDDAVDPEEAKREPLEEPPPPGSPMEAAAAGRQWTCWNLLNVREDVCVCVCHARDV
jgi:hypothetical protein